MALISERLDRVRFLLGNRTDIDDRIVEWYVDAFRELGMSIPFFDLESTFDDQFVANQAEYDYPEGARSVKALTMFQNNAAYNIVKKDIRLIERIPESYVGIPVIWAPYGNQIIVRPVPNIAYDFRWRFWVIPDIAVDPADTVLTIPDDWLTVLDHLTAELGHMALGERDKAQELHMLIHGDPKHPADNPGWIREKLTRDQAENLVSDYGIRMKIRRYNVR